MTGAILVIIGPTAAGKSDLALDLAADDFEIVSADSVQVYRYMDIGSSKPGSAEQAKVPHHLIDVVLPDYQFTAGDFCNRASSACEKIKKNRKIPMFVGGSGLYIDSFFYGISRIPDIESHIKAGLNEEMNQRGAAALYDELAALDPVFALKIHCNDRQRIIRGLEIYRGTGRTASYFHSEKINYSGEKTLFIGLSRERDELAGRIDDRVGKMMALGFVDEVQSLRRMGYSPELNSMKSIGYSEINEFIDNKIDLSTAIDEIKKNTKRYAKKQMTWFRKNKDINWFHPAEIKKIKNAISNWLNII